MKAVSERQKALMWHIGEYSYYIGRPPSLGELASAMGVSSTGSICAMLQSLRRKGMVAWDKHKSRTVRLTGGRVKYEDDSFVLETCNG